MCCRAEGLAEQVHLAGIKFHEPQRGSNGCGFARAVCTDETDDLAWRYGKVHVAQREAVANLALCIFDFQKVRHDAAFLFTRFGGYEVKRLMQIGAGNAERFGERRRLCEQCFHASQLFFAQKPLIACCDEAALALDGFDEARLL